MRETAEAGLGSFFLLFFLFLGFSFGGRRQHMRAKYQSALFLKEGHVQLGIGYGKRNETKKTKKPKKNTQNKGDIYSTQAG